MMMMMMMNKKPFKALMMMIICLLINFPSLIEMKTEVDVGVVVDMKNWVGEMGLSCIRLALSDFYEAHVDYTTRLVLHTRDSMGDVIGAAAKAVDLIKNVEVEAIIGPITSMQADIVIQIGEKTQVPIISYSATSPSLTSIPHPYFFRATKNDSSQVNAIASIVQAFGWRQAVLVYVDNDFGQGIIPYLIDSLLSVDARVPYRSTISPVATDEYIVRELYKLMTMQTRVFIVHLPPNLGSRFFTKAREVGMMSEGYVWITTDGIIDFLSTLSPLVFDSMQGVLGVRPYLGNQENLEKFRVRWKRKFVEDNPGKFDAELNIYGLWAYDTAVALAMAVEKAMEFGLEKVNKNVPSNYSTDLENLGVSKNGPPLLRALSETKFEGLTGEFIFVEGQLPSPAFEIVNINGKTARGIGFWTPRNGLVKTLDTSISTNLGTASSNSKNLGTIIWPGDSFSVPKGWEIPTNGKKLRIGVPVKSGFNEFVKVTRDFNTNTTTFTGFCRDVFDAVIKALPYALPHEFIPFDIDDDGEDSRTYNDLIYQVYQGKFDAVVGDTTIIFNRSLYVDFTLPYTESGVSMVVPTEDKRNKNAWVFLKPLTWDLWVASFCFFLFIGFVVWILEHRINEEFRGPRSHQLGTSLFFSFSTMVFAQRERVVSNTAKVVVIVWCFVVLILTQSYTASLASLLTIQQLLPTVTDVNQLIKHGDRVGHKRGSFVSEILKNMGFDETRLVIYDTAEECDELLSKGTKNGGISAAFDELPYMKVFLGKYCPKYASAAAIYKTDGFGFVFPKGSPLVSDISRAILNVTEGDKMKEIERAWFGTEPPCPDPTTSVSTDSNLGLQSFWGLFLIAGIISVLALLIFSVMFVYEQRQVLMDSDSVWSKILKLFRIFDQKSHTFRGSDENIMFHLANSTAAPSPSSVQTDLGSRIRPFLEVVVNDHAAAASPSSVQTDSNSSVQAFLELVQLNHHDSPDSNVEIATSVEVTHDNDRWPDPIRHQ
ncbi:glutamate receptor 2.2 [Euphorbia peplus]|nr:glutamate receptor 2.2 [Euphorbia peplus]